mmetsp:Transcript_33016/g.32726  ORF Transcript_33016/g.32726 Transcript_33016/m.32726 type:complete len:294 (-) Transcript_33016:35-916(-)
MRVFLTGATGSIGSSVLKSLVAAGHEVTCTARNDQKGQEIVQKGGHYIIFELSPDSVSQLSELCVGYDAIIHTALVLNEEGVRTEHLLVPALIAAAKKTAETKPVVLLTTSGCMCNGETQGPMDEDHDDTSRSHPWVAFKPTLERMVINASSGNFHGCVIRPVWVYGNSFVDQWVRESKAKGKIIAASGNKHVSVIHTDDIAEMYRVLIENRAVGLFYGSEQPIQVETIIEKVSEAIGVTDVERYDNVTEVPNYPWFALAHTLDCQLISKRIKDLYGFVPRHNFFEWLRTEQF